MNLSEVMDELTDALERARQLTPESETDLQAELGLWAAAARGCAENLALSIAEPCKSCGYYFGETHGPTTLVCALHPSGPEGESCEDWEAEGQGT